MHLGQFSMGAAGLVMTEATAVSPAGRISPKCLGLYSDENEAALKRVIDFCREYGVTAMGIQLAHAGRKGSTQIPADGGQPLGTAENPWTTLAPSALPFGPGWHLPQALDREGLAAVKGEFAASVSIWPNCTVPTAICCTSFCLQSATSATTRMGANSKIGCVIHWRYSRPFEPHGLKTNLWVFDFQPLIGLTGDGPWKNPWSWQRS
jgi:hypothetical protein